jgi:hypothetical protein
MGPPPRGERSPRLDAGQLSRELSALREILEARLDAMDRATRVLDATVNRTPTVIQTEISHVRELNQERFASVGRQFEAAEQARRAAEENTSHRFDLLAEWREGIADQLADFPNRAEIRAQLDGISSAVSALNGRVSAFIQEQTIFADRYLTKDQFAAAEKGREAERKEGRRAMTTAVVAVGVAVIGWIIIIVLALVTHKA